MTWEIVQQKEGGDTGSGKWEVEGQIKWEVGSLAQK